MPRTTSTLAMKMAFLRELRTIGPGPVCVNWPWAPLSRLGHYTRVSLGSRGTLIGAHRWVYEQVNGPVPDGFEVCHTCDNRTCVRPSHLWLGTHSQNMIDAYSKGRKMGNRTNHAVGEAHHGAKLTEAQVYEIRDLCANGVTHGRVAAQFGVERSLIQKIATRKLWRYLPEKE